jgi:predicted DCC family thiol-disulfide oxidoreductase YuxK
LSSAPAAPFRPRHLVFYDGVCGLCNRLVRWLLRADRDELLGFASLQGATARQRLGEHGVIVAEDTLYVLAGCDSPQPRLLSRSAAVLFLLEATGRRRTAGILSVLPVAVLDWGYDRVAATRYHLFGRYATCPLPSAEHRRRFLDMSGG